MFSLRKIWDVSAQVVVDAPPDKVFSYVADFDRHHEWLGEYAEVEKTSEGPVAVGSTFRSMARLGPLEVQVDLVVTEYTPNERFTYERRGRDTTFYSLSIQLEAEPVSGGTRVIVRKEGGRLFAVVGMGADGALAARGPSSRLQPAQDSTLGVSGEGVLRDARPVMAFRDGS